MNIADIQKLIELARAHDIDEIEVEAKDIRVRITGRHRPPKVRYVAQAIQPAAAPGFVAAPSSGMAPSPELAPLPAGAAPAAASPSGKVSAALPASSAATAAKGGATGKADAGGCPPGCVEILSPMVGTFYRAPAPDSPPFVEIGSRVEPSDTVCIIEAMKLMNEIKAEARGVARAILVENGEPVEFGQPLFYLDKV
jgi:acetyl-CoA carboxylase biotin carboxyl carrier protein